LVALKVVSVYFILVDLNKTAIFAAIKQYKNKTIFMDNNKISTLKRIIEDNEIRSGEAKEVLEHHLNQLQRLGATLEDSVCGILRKVIARSEAEEELERMTEGIWRK
jgi:hypothetical protein